MTAKLTTEDTEDAVDAQKKENGISDCRLSIANFAAMVAISVGHLHQNRQSKISNRQWFLIFHPLRPLRQIPRLATRNSQLAARCAMFFSFAP
jgi:hypothetical protein